MPPSSSKALWQTRHRAADLQGAVAADLDWKAMHNDTFQALTHSKISMERGRFLPSPHQAGCLLQ